jgi:hypothetical protein
MLAPRQGDTIQAIEKRFIKTLLTDIGHHKSSAATDMQKSQLSLFTEKLQCLNHFVYQTAVGIRANIAPFEALGILAVRRTTGLGLAICDDLIDSQK